MSGPKGCELDLLQQERDRLARERDILTESSRYHRLMESWSSVQTRYRNLLIAESFHPTSHAELKLQLDSLIRSGSDAQALRMWQSKSSELENAISQANAKVAARILELESRSRSYSAGIEDYPHRLQTVIQQLESLIPRDWPDADQKAMHTTLAPLRIESAPAPFKGSGWNPENVRFLETNEAALTAKQDFLRTRAKDFENQLQQIHSGHVTSSVLSGAVAAQKLEDFLRTLESSSIMSAPSSVATDQIFPDNTEAKLEKLLRDIIALEDSFDWRTILADAERIRAERDLSHRKNLYANLVIRCSGRLKEVKALSQWRENLFKLIDRTSSLPEDKALARFRDRLEMLVKRDLPENLAPLEKELDSILGEAIARQEQEKKRRAVIESLAELGYQASEGMELAVAKGGKLEFRKPGEKEYAVSVVMDGGSEILETEMVRYASSQDMTAQQKQRDIEKEEGWCSDHARVRQAMQTRGVATKFLYQKRPGEHPVTVKVVQSDRRNRETAATKPQVRRLSN